jgi:membrane-bound lytic murein transglycosylase A
MSNVLEPADAKRSLLPAAILESPSGAFGHDHRPALDCEIGDAPDGWIRRALGGMLVAVLAACADVPLQAPPAPDVAPTPPVAVEPGPSAVPAPMADGTIVRSRARWVPARWTELPGWDTDRSTELWPALLRGCDRPAAGWAAICAQARTAVTPAFSDDAARAWIQQRLQPYRIESLEGAPDGLITGYFEPLVDASRTAHGSYRIPLYMTPADLATRKPYWTRQQIDTLPAAQAGLRGRALAFVADPLDALILQIQGSGRLSLAEPDGSRKLVRVAYAGHNDQPYKSVGRWLIDQGELLPIQASWPGIKNWARQNPKRLNEMLWSNPRMVFFREEPLPDPQVGPKGAQGVALTPGRSIAVDAQSIPYGTPVWLDSTEPLSSAPLRRLVMAQDTGTAITGAVRADYFWGWGSEAEAQAGRMKQPLRLWVLWPRS